MDRIHKPDEQSFVSPLISVRDFYEKCLPVVEQLALPAVDVAQDEEGPSASSAGLHSIAAQMRCTVDVCTELQRLCDPEKLKNGTEPDEEEALDDRVPESNLLTLKLLKEDNKKRSLNHSYKQSALMSSKYYRINFRVLDTMKLSAVPRGPYQPPDVILSVMFMKPYNRQLEYHEIRMGRLLKPDACFLVCGKTSLSRLRDKISCASDFAYDREFSDNPHDVLQPNLFSRDRYPSNLFFIHNTFYNDMRDPKSNDISQTVLDWASRRTKEVGPFHTANMEDTQFMDLKLRLGQPYVYMHQGSCEHLFVVSDVRLMNADDCQLTEDYPVQILHKLRKRAYCCACKIYTAKWVSYENDRLPVSPAFFCEECFRKFHYDKEGNKKGHFKAVPYFDRIALS